MRNILFWGQKQTKCHTQEGVHTNKQMALVTGASSGIGEAISRALAQRGWLVIGIARSSDKLSRIQQDLQVIH